MWRSRKESKLTEKGLAELNLERGERDSKTKGHKQGEGPTAL